jgi:hypothetical protein
MTQEWIFTFGSGQRLVPPGYPDVEGLSLQDRYVRIAGDTWDYARDEMERRFGRQWAFQYHTEEEAGVQRFGLRELS